MRRLEMLEYLQQDAPRLPVWVISYNRFADPVSPTLERMRKWADLSDVFVIVRETQVLEYELAFPELNFVALPPERINSCGAARWGAFDMAREMGHTRVVMLDDDLLQFRFLYEYHVQSGPNEGNPCSRVAVREDLEELGGIELAEELTVAAMGRTANWAFEQYPQAVIATAIKRLRAFDVRNHSTMYIYNDGVTPRQWTVWDIERMEEHGVRLDLKHFGIVGEDVGLMATLLEKDLDAITLPSFAYSYWDQYEGPNRKQEENDKTTIRTPGIAGLLSEYEHLCLQEYDMGKHYLKVCPSGGDEYEWGEVDWRRMRAFRRSGTARYYWPPDAIRETEGQLI